VAVIEGDQQTSHDADRIRATGAPAIQVNTGKGCHLDAPMVAEAFARLDLHAACTHDHHHSHTTTAGAAVHRERRQPGLPRDVGPGRSGQGGHPVGDRGRGQAAQVPRHVRRRVG
jgi:hypothetical protein